MARICVRVLLCAWGAAHRPSAWTTALQRVLLWLGSLWPQGRSSSPRTRGALVSFQAVSGGQQGALASREAGRPRPPSLTPGFRADPEPGPGAALSLG